MREFHLVQLKNQPERRHHFADDLVLHRKDVRERSVVACVHIFGPGTRIDQLDSDSDLIGGFCTLPSNTYFTPSSFPISCSLTALPL